MAVTYYLAIMKAVNPLMAVQRDYNAFGQKHQTRLTKFAWQWMI